MTGGIAPAWSNPLVTPTYDGSGQAVHPATVDFGSAWNGYRYWMAMTPYPGGDDQYENPSILVSDDGWTWSVPAGLTNPIDATPSGGYNADVELVHDPATDKLFCFYLSHDGTNKATCVRSSSDGITWSAETVLFTTVVATRNDVSPSVFLDGSTWKMWTIVTTTSPNTVELRTASTPDGTWSAPSTCSITPPSGRDLWHFDVIKSGSTYYMAVSDATLDSNGVSSGDIYLAASSDGVTWNLGTTPILVNVPGTWTSNRLYRPSILIDGTTLRMWYSAFASGEVCRIGYDEFDTALFPSP